MEISFTYKTTPMKYLELSETHKRILDMLVMGRSYKEIAEQLKISKLTLYAYIRDMNRNNECNIYQIIYKYAKNKNNVDTNND